MIGNNYDHEIRTMINFAEGNINVFQFMEILRTNIKLQKILGCHYRQWNSVRFGREVIPFLERLDVSKINDSCVVFNIISGYLSDSKIPFCPTNSYNERYDFMIRAMPHWLNGQNEDFFLKVFNSMPHDLTKSKRIKWCKERIKELFTYDVTPPRWIQNSEWPMSKSGRPMIFRKQTKEEKESELVRYFFYDPETNEEKIIEQFY